MKPVDFHPLARKEARQAAAHYLRAGQSLANDFRFRLTEALQLVRSNPLGFAANAKGERTAPLKKFPYKVVYREFNTHIWIAAVGHHRRRPGYWSRRKP